MADRRETTTPVRLAIWRYRARWLAGVIFMLTLARAFRVTLQWYISRIIASTFRVGRHLLQR